MTVPMTEVPLQPSSNDKVLQEAIQVLATLRAKKPWVAPLVEVGL